MTRKYRDVEAPTGKELLYRFSVKFNDLSKTMSAIAYDILHPINQIKYDDAVESIQKRINDVQRDLNMGSLERHELIQKQKAEQKEEDDEYLCKFTFGEEKGETTESENRDG